MTGEAVKKAVIFGAGSIGRGFIGQLFSESGYEVVFIDVNTALVDGLNREKAYPLRLLEENGSRETLVGPVRAVNGSEAALAAAELEEAHVAATAVGAGILPRIAPLLAQGLALRWQRGNTSPLNILLCENLMDAHLKMEKWLKEALQPSLHPLLEQTTGLVETSVGRMVPVMTPERLAEKPLLLWVEAYSELPADGSAFKGALPYIKNMIPYSPFSFYIQRKLFIHNMGHALSAYLGGLKGYTFIWEVVADPYLRCLVIKAMQDSAVALSLEHGSPLPQLLTYVDNLIRRFGNKALGDTVQRVGRDTRRKLAPEDRLTGAARLCLRHGILPVNMAMGMGAALLFEGESPEAANEVYGLVREDGAEAVLAQVCGLNPDEALFSMVLDYYSMMKNQKSLYGFSA